MEAGLDRQDSEHRKGVILRSKPSGPWPGGLDEFEEPSSYNSEKK